MSDPQPPATNGANGASADGADAHPSIHPVAPRLKNGHKVPHIGPHIHAYRAAHSQTVGHESDKWWAKVRPTPSDVLLLLPRRRIGEGHLPCSGRDVDLP